MMIRLTQGDHRLGLVSLDPGRTSGLLLHLQLCPVHFLVLACVWLYGRDEPSGISTLSKNNSAVGEPLILPSAVSQSHSIQLDLHRTCPSALQLGILSMTSLPRRQSVLSMLDLQFLSWRILGRSKIKGHWWSYHINFSQVHHSEECQDEMMEEREGLTSISIHSKSIYHPFLQLSYAYWPHPNQH
jgi:hypothetical protein